ncbi:MAG: RNA 2',3'-cyclic phosphodiesterase [Candidatus Marsarchaeota archaeon]|jgi:2'-5' RNA ligase|nr:RNA 2',3'-cyclic phosphodiesterase [Candidatus Marsarchaeota archaeon]
MQRRVFLAIDLPEEIRTTLGAASQALKTNGVTVVRQDLYHITLQFIGNADEDGIERIKEAMGQAESKAFMVKICGAGFFGAAKIKVIFAEVREGRAELIQLYEKLSSCMDALEIRYENRRAYTPHVTLARVKGNADNGYLLSSINALAPADFGAFEASSIKLKSSTSSDAGIEYSDLYESKLTGL